ncbi:hypothetical protein ACS5PN_10245 [Roseateles sp. NT4]|uniref:hypothetical protein n=1 Tax=Roseateles sp. NT4 TaxID=3453715 RepID=UPI003EEA6F74
MKRIALPLSAALWMAAAQAAPDPGGRWEGVAEIPGAPLPLVVDLSSASTGALQGSVILPGRGVKGAPLQALAADDKGLGFSLAAAFNPPAEQAPRVNLRWQADGTLVGEWQQSGLSAALQLRRTGAAQVDLPVAPTALSPELLGRWIGRYELGGYPREVTLTLANGPAGLGAGELVVVGKRRTELKVDHVVQGREFLTLKASAANYRIEGRHAADRIEGQVLQGPFEAAIVLRRDVAGAKP